MPVSGAELLFGGLVAVFFGYSVVTADEGDRAERLKALAWGAVFAFTVWFVWATYGVEGAVDGLLWLFSDGLMWVGLVLVLFLGYVWQSAAAETDSLQGAIRQMQVEASQPFTRAIGAISALGIVLATVFFEVGTSSVELLGFAGGLVAEAPVVASNLVAIVGGAIGFGWEIPILGSLVPEWLSTMPPLWWFGITIGLLGVGLAIRESRNFSMARDGDGGM